MLINQALVAAWKGACKVAGATVKIPAQLKFLIKPVTLQGPCMPHLTLQVSLFSLYVYTDTILINLSKEGIIIKIMFCMRHLKVGCV